MYLVLQTPATSELTMDPKAEPIIMPTAMSTAFLSMATSLNSFKMFFLICRQLLPFDSPRSHLTALYVRVQPYIFLTFLCFFMSNQLTDLSGEKNEH